MVERSKLAEGHLNPFPQQVMYAAKVVKMWCENTQEVMLLDAGQGKTAVIILSVLMLKELEDKKVKNVLVNVANEFLVT